jgi:hypothetical protein
MTAPSQSRDRKIERLRVEMLGPRAPFDGHRFGAFQTRVARLGNAHEGSLLVLISIGLYLLAVVGALEGLRLGPDIFSFMFGATALGTSAAISSHLSFLAQRK